MVDVAVCGHKNRYMKDVFSKEIGLCAQNAMTNISSIVNINRRVTRPLINKHENLHIEHE